ncbi:transposase [Beduini sp.]|uniref:transposase n=1 Tax=Beduini sp. TaxID=1922300 RepID=UPI00399F1E66
MYAPYKRPTTKKGFFKKYEYVYDEGYDCYICPNIKILEYRITNKLGYKKYKSEPEDCKNCSFLNKCTQSKKHQKVITRHVWEEIEKKLWKRYDIRLNGKNDIPSEKRVSNVYLEIVRSITI